MDPISAIASAVAQLVPFAVNLFGGHEHYDAQGLTFGQEDALLAENQAEIDRLTGQPVFMRSAPFGSSQDKAALKQVVADALGQPGYENSDFGDLHKRGIIALALQAQQQKIAALQSSGNVHVLLLTGGAVVLLLFLRRRI